jgi:PAS domain S-box-containing protein
MREPIPVQEISEKLLRLAVHAAPCGILVADQGGDIMFANRALLQMFGYTADELVGQPVEILVPGKDAETHRLQRERFNKQPSVREMGIGKNFHGVTKDGREFPVEIGLQPGESKEGRIVVATIIDISRRRGIEDRLHRDEEHLEELVAERTQELHQAQEEKERVMEQLIQADKMASIGTLVSGIGHEINNPLYVVLGMAEAIGKEEDISLRNEYSAQIIKHCKQIAETVKNLSSYAQPSSKHDLQLVDLNESIAAAVLVARRSLQTEDIEIRQNARVVPGILAKSEEIQQVLVNFIRNGIQASGKNGLIEIKSQQSGEWVVISIRDTGTGIPAGMEKKIFDPFFTTKGPDEGQGLGLYIVQQIVTKYGGTIYLDSKGGTGTTFTIKFPVADQNRLSQEEDMPRCTMF